MVTCCRGVSRRASRMSWSGGSWERSWRHPLRRMISDWLFHVALAVGIICGLALASASAHSQVVQWEGMVPDSRYPTHDRWGNKYPPACRKDLSFLIGRYVTVERK